MRTIEFFISRRGELQAAGEPVGTFLSVDAAANAAVRFCQENDCLYRIFYPL